MRRSPGALTQVLDSLIGLGPIHDMAIADMALGVGEMGGGAAGTVGGSKGAPPPQSLVAAVGNQKTGALAILRRSVLPDVVGSEATGEGVAAQRAPDDLHTDLM